MKKITIAAAVAAALGTNGSDAYFMGLYSSGVLVPRVVHNGPGDTTAVGLTTADADHCPFLTPGGDPAQSGTVYWTFFDVDSNHVTDGSFPMTNNDVYPFVWAEESGLGLEGKEGYLVFLLDQNNDGQLELFESNECLTAEAFHVVTADSDVAFVPTWPVDTGAYGLDLADIALAGSVDLATLGPTSLTTLTAGAGFGGAFAGVPVRLSLRYSIAGGDTTDIVVWSADSVGGPDVVYTVNIFDDEQNRRSVNFPLPNAQQNTIDPAAIAGRPADFVNGFIRWEPPLSAGCTQPPVPDPGSLPDTYTDNGCDGNGVVSYSVIDTQAFGARQTIINGWYFAP
ncbi:MAG TPA: hypothetical protein ENK62_06275 [Chromatiales bacterium]|nr:hypothetical protein [Chromatiales bacterium]